MAEPQVADFLTRLAPMAARFASGDVSAVAGLVDLVESERERIRAAGDVDLPARYRDRLLAVDLGLRAALVNGILMDTVRTTIEVLLRDDDEAASAGRAEPVVH